LQPVADEVSVGSSGTTLYFLLGLAALSDRPVRIVGQRYFKRRPIGPLLRALTELGVRLEADGDCLPVTVYPGIPRGGRVRIDGTLSQWISGLLMLAPFALEPTTIEVAGEVNERPYIELTIDMLREFGLQVSVREDWRRFDVEPGQQPRATDVVLPPDLGSVVFPLAACALHPSRARFRSPTSIVGHPEAAVLENLRSAGVPLRIDYERGLISIDHDGEPPRGGQLDCRHLPDMVPVLSVLASRARGSSVLGNVAHVRLKESDRVASMLQLRRMGARVDFDGQDMRFEGVSDLHGATLSSFNDHRVLMALAVAGASADGVTELSFPHAYRISYPEFLEHMNALGVPAAVSNGAPPPNMFRPEHVPSRLPPARHPASLSAAARESSGFRADQVRPGAGAHVRRPKSNLILDDLDRHASERPQARAVVAVDSTGEARELSWAQLRAGVDRAAVMLLDLGVKPAEPVAFQLPNRLEFVTIALATLRIGAICEPLMPIFRERELDFMVRESDARVLLVPDRFRGRNHEAMALSLRMAVPSLTHVVVLDTSHHARHLGHSSYGQLLAAAEPDPERLAPLRPAPDCNAQLLFTSGTSGQPKGVLHSHEVLTRAADAHIAHFGLGADDVVYVPSPLAHQTGFLYGMWIALRLGVPQLLQEVWDPAAGLEAMSRFGATFVQAATPFLADLVKLASEQDERPHALRTFVATGAAIPRELAREATEVLGGEVGGAWGTTETCLGTAFVPGEPDERAWATDGRALPGVEVRIVDDSGRPLAPGVEGNFEVRCDYNFKGYLNRPDLTAEAFTADGYYRTGDLATVDPEGHVRITGRVKDLINRGGEKIPVAEIEQLLYSHPAVSEVAIVAMPDERLGERACAFVVLREGADFDFAAMTAYLDEQRVAKTYWPERLELVAALPRTPSGKIQKFILREMASDFAREREALT
jgi:3-phosphoshikimate 1-carboxyvinyltransferase